jgi:hypothetical protein
MYMIRNDKGLYWSGSTDTFTDYTNATCYGLRLQVHKYVAENKDAFGTDHIIVEEVICL